MIQPLTPDRLRKSCDLSVFDFETTNEVTPDMRIIGQPRGTKAILFGIEINSPGYNIYVLGESGTGRTTAIKRFVETQAEDDPIPPDWVYLYNFSEPQRPLAVSLPPGMGAKCRDGMAKAVDKLKIEIPRAFDTQSYRNKTLEIQHSLTQRREALFDSLQKKANSQGAAVIGTTEGVKIVPAAEGKPVSPEQFREFTDEQLENWSEVSRAMEKELAETIYQVNQLENNIHEDIQKMDREIAGQIVDRVMAGLKDQFDGYPKIVSHIERVHRDISENSIWFRGRQDDSDNPRQALVESLQFRRYQVNVLIDHTGIKSAPVVVENNPTVPNLLGRVEHEMHFGGQVTTDFTLLRCGSLQAANGGYLVIRAKDLFTEPGSWDALKRALVGGSVSPDDLATRGGATTRSLNPQKIPLKLKVILIGPPQLYFTLHEQDEDFRSIFKVMADFALDMERNPENEKEYTIFIAHLTDEEDLLPFSREAVGRVVEYGSRLAGSQKKLSSRFGNLANLIRESSYWAQDNGQDVVRMQDVRQAIYERIYHRNRIENRIRDLLHEGKQIVASVGAVVGQINGLSVSQIGEHAFGQPSRVTARTFAGRAGVVQIDREVELAGPLHNKGVLTLSGYLGGTYAQDMPLSLSAQITFEQNYGGVDGDSASSTELYAILSSLSDVPIQQSIAVTGSVNQLGEIQAIGGATEKIEGWFDVCNVRGLTGTQGVIIPASNINDLMLRDEVIDAVKSGNFHIWGVSLVDEGIEILTGTEAKKIHGMVKNRLRELAEVVKAYGGALS